MRFPRLTFSLRTTLIAVAMIAIAVAAYTATLVQRAGEYRALLRYYEQEEQQLRAEANDRAAHAEALAKEAERAEALAREKELSGDGLGAARVREAVRQWRAQETQDRAEAAFDQEMIEVAMAAQRTYRRLARRPWLSRGDAHDPIGKGRGKARVRGSRTTRPTRMMRRGSRGLVA